MEKHFSKKEENSFLHGTGMLPSSCIVCVEPGGEYIEDPVFSLIFRPVLLHQPAILW